MVCNNQYKINPVATGKYDYRVEMWYQGAYIGYALVTGLHSQRSARALALRGVVTSVYPMSERDKVVFLTKKAELWNK